MTKEQAAELPSAASVLRCFEYLATMFIRGALALSEKYPAHPAYYGNTFIESGEFQLLLAAYKRDLDNEVSSLNLTQYCGCQNIFNTDISVICVWSVTSRA